MTLSEFKAWLDGFSCAMGDAPTPEQWATIKEKLATVEVFKASAPTIGTYLMPSARVEVPTYTSDKTMPSTWISGPAGATAELRYYDGGLPKFVSPGSLVS